MKADSTLEAFSQRHNLKIPYYSFVATVPFSKDLGYVSVGLVTGITYEIFEVNMECGTEQFLQTLTSCWGISRGGQFDIGKMCSATSPSH